MADCKNYAAESKENTQNHTKINSSMILNRSFTTNSSSPSASEITNTPLHSLFNSPSIQRSSSIMNIYTSSFDSLKGKVSQLCSIFESPPQKNPNPQITPKPQKLVSTDSDSKNSIPFRLPGTEDRVVIYFTSLRGIRKTFNDCHSIRMIFRAFRVNLDERDISMDISYRKELHKVLLESNFNLPQVFIKGKYIGGADVIRHLLEAGELQRLINGIPLCSPKPCENCGDVRFFPCTKCSGSRKVFDEEEDRVKRCTECNENGLVRCTFCCS